MSIKKRELKPEQAAAAYELTKHISVTAGPGSGKTTVLVERYLHILREDKPSIDQIVAITFTNRAANEMRERLREELNLILQTTKGEDRRHWLSYKRTLDGAVITTIHGFCARLLREFPVEARIDPQFILLDEHRAAMLLESVVEETLSEFISAGHLEISRLTLGVGRSRLAAALVQLYREARGQGLTFAELAQKTAASHTTESDYQLALTELDTRVAELLNWPKLSSKAAEKRQNFMAAWPTVRAILNTIPDHDSLADYCAMIEQLREHRPGKAPFGDLSTRLDDLLWGNVSNRANNYSGLVPQTCFDSFARLYALEMINVLTRVHDRLTEEKQKVSALDFDDLEVKTLALLEMPEVLARAADRYKFFLVDEFQDTNGLQLRLLEKLAFSQKRKDANLFIVGDRKQSIYGFRGADVDVFRKMTETLIAEGGESRTLLLNFRSQPPLINFFNHLFERLFVIPEDIPSNEIPKLGELGYVEHEKSISQRELKPGGPLVELLITTRASLANDPRAEQDSRHLDATQLARRINALIRSQPDLKYSDIALLFRAMTQVQIYESVFRRANIPYQTVLGRGFYERAEITDLIQLLRFLDNKTDELALAAVLRSPLCGISDNALFALRCAPTAVHVHNDNGAQVLPTRSLYRALRQHREIAFITDDEHDLLDRAERLISRLIARRHHYAIEDLLRFAVEESEYLAVIAANFDGAQRLSNVQRLFTLAARFEHSGTHLIRDFVRYVEEFEAIGSRESEGQMDEAANAVRLMTIHQAKGLEFPVVIIPELHRLSRVSSESSFLLDRHRGLTLKVPDGRGKQVAGSTLSDFEKRNALREQFESMRLLYVAATRSEDRLILSGITDELVNLTAKNDSWLKWIWQALELQNHRQSGVIDLADDVQLQLTLNLAHQPEPVAETRRDEWDEPSAESLRTAFPLMQPVTASAGGVHRFSVTQLINYQRCPRQYYFERILELPSRDELAVWNNAEAPEPPANLTAALKGAVIHRFCERYSADQDIEGCLRRTFDEVVRLRQAELADRLVEINVEAAIKDLLPLAQNYLSSDLFQRVEAARRLSAGIVSSQPGANAGLWSELSFRLRRPLGVLSGAIDKLLITRSSAGQAEVEIIDFKTNRINASSLPAKGQEVTASMGSQAVRMQRAEGALPHGPNPASSKRLAIPRDQFAFDFEATVPDKSEGVVHDAVSTVAVDYRLQMQSYALAVRELIPELADAKIRVTLHFLDPNVEFQIPPELLATEECARLIDEAMIQIASSSEPTHFPVKPAPHCRTCSFLKVCASGREFLREE